MSEESDIELRIILLGDPSTNKTSFLSKYIQYDNSIGRIATVGVDIRQKNITMKNMKIKLKIFDTAGQERYRNLALNFLKGSDGAILLYDITNDYTFNSLKNYYIKYIEEINPYIKYIIAGNNCDLDNCRMISREKVEKFCETKNVEYIEVSSKLDIGIKESFEMLIKSIIKDMTKEELIYKYSKKYKDVDCKDCKIYDKKKRKKRIFSGFDKCICF